MTKFLFLLFILSTNLIAKELETPKCLEPNIEFWKQILTKYSENDLVFHNESTLEIYKVVRLETLDKLERKRALVQVYKEMEDILNSEDLDNLRAQSGISNKFTLGLIRSHKYLPYIKKVFKEEGIPEDIIFLPHVESSFNPKAGSRVGAKGLWQIMPGTARMYGTRNAYKLYNPEYATRLAAKILKDNYSILGSWDLAINAYNSGIGNLKRAVEFTSSKDICTILRDYRQGSFKFASRNYLGQFYAVLDIIKERKEDDEDDASEVDTPPTSVTPKAKVKTKTKVKTKHKYYKKNHKHKHKVKHKKEPSND